uniref:Uncharacterized protein n=1 Tax=Meloidogyne enterolobii TaxID=390850 RepID=A0A6V7UN74_MELEN|nr:unnamed protein product [Meloidogyne enterolobii]
MSLLSPRLLSLFPSKKLKRPEFLSPELFSFSGDGILPLPKLFQLMSPNKDSREPMEWIDFILEISGAGKQLEQLLKNPEIKYFNQKIWPVIQLVKQKEELWERLEKSFNYKQRRELSDKGFINLERWQLEMFFGKEFKENEWINNSNNRLEEKIKLLASLKNKEEEESDYKNYLGVKRRRRRRESNNLKRGIIDGGGSSHEFPDPIVPLPPLPPPLPLPSPLPLPEPFPPPLPPPLPLPLPEPLPPLPPPLPPLPPPLPLPQPTPVFIPVRPPPPPFGGSTVIGGIDSNGDQFLTPWGRSPDTEVNIATVPRNVLLSPWAFQNRFGGVILEGIYLSPYAFASEIISPEVLTLKVASPSAFIAAILSPLALTARITSPSAFRSQILSPEALSAYLLSPDVFLAEILSPAVMQTRVLSPKALFVQILSPMLASPRLASPQFGGLVVLSPNFLSPRINSQEGLQVEILSPHILGGEHEGLEGDRWTIDGATHYIGFPGLFPANGPF